MNLSRGQRQRIVLAIDIVKHPKLLIFNGATRTLDSYNEVKKFEYIKA